MQIRIYYFNILKIIKCIIWIKCKNIYKNVTQLTNHKCLFKNAIHKNNTKHKYKLKERKFCNKGYIQKWRCKQHMEQCQ